MKRALFFFIFLPVYTFAFAQTFSLSDCINYAHTHRIELQKQQTADTYYNKNHRYSIYGALPSVSGTVNYPFTSDRHQSMRPGVVELSSELVLFNGFQTINDIRQSKLLTARNRSQTDKIRNDIQLEITEIYYSLLLARENIKIFENSIQSAEQQISLISQSVQAGRTSNIDLLEMQAQLEKERSNRIAAVRQYERDFIRLKRAMNYQSPSNLPEGEAFLLATPFTEASPLGRFGGAEDLFLSAISTLPEFRLARQDSLFAVYDLRKVKGQYAPYLSLSGSLSSQYQRAGESGSFINQLENNFLRIAGVSLTIPIYSRHQIRRQQIGKERQLSDILLDNKQLYQDVYFEIERLYQEIVQNQENLQAAERRRDYSKQIYEMRREQYRYGTLSITDLLIAENNMRNAEIEWLYAKYSLQYNMALVEFYSGKM